MFVSRESAGLKGLTLDEPAAEHLKIGVQMIGNDGVNTPPALPLSRRGIVDNVRGYMLYGDYSKPNPPAQIVTAVANGDIDVALVWGPLAGYFAAQSKVPLRLEPVTPWLDDMQWPMQFDVSVGVQKDNQPLLKQVDQIWPAAAPTSSGCWRATTCRWRSNKVLAGRLAPRPVHADPVQQAAGDHSGAAVDMLARIGIAQLVERLAEQQQPAVEQRPVETRNHRVLDHRVAEELARAEQDRAPETLHPFQVRRPVADPRIEDRPEFGIPLDPVVETLDQIGNERLVDSEGKRLPPLRLAGGEGMRGRGGRHAWDLMPASAQTSTGNPGPACNQPFAGIQPKVNEKASTPASRNSMVKVRSRIGPFVRTSW